MHKTDIFSGRLVLTLPINPYTLSRFACGNGWRGWGEMERVSSWQAVSVINAWARDRSDEDNAVKDSLSRSLSFHPTVSLNSWSAEQKRITYAGLMHNTLCWHASVMVTKREMCFHVFTVHCLHASDAAVSSRRHWRLSNEIWGAVCAI